MRMIFFVDLNGLPARWLRLVAAGVVLFTLLDVIGCASAPELASQTVEVRIASEVREWRGLLECRASNALGSWTFIAPGEVTVLKSTTALRIECRAPPGAIGETSAPVSYLTRQQQGAKDAKTGAWVGAGAGTALAVASAPFLGAGGVLFIVGGAEKGYEYGGYISVLQPDQLDGYPSPITVHLIPSTPPR